MKLSGLVGWLLLAGVTVARPKLHRRQVSSLSDGCTCPVNGPATTTVIQSTISTSLTTITGSGSTVFSTGPTATSYTSLFPSITTIITDTTTIVFPGFTETTIASSAITSIITATISLTTCITSTPLRIKRQATGMTTMTSDLGTTTGSSITNAPDAFTTTSIVGSKRVTCACIVRSRTNTLAGTSTCQCPATTSMITVSSLVTGITISTVTVETPTLVIVTPSVVSAIVVTQLVTSSSQATVTSTESSLTVTSESIETVFATFTPTVFSCPSSTSISSSTSSVSSDSSTVSATSIASPDIIAPSTTTSTSVAFSSSSTSILPTISSSSTSISRSTSSTTRSSSSTSAAATPEGTTFICNATAYYIGSGDTGPVQLYNIDLSTGKTIVLASGVGSGTYTAINAMGYNPLDNYLYAIAQISTGNYAVIRFTTTGSFRQILAFTASALPTSGDVDVNGQFWFTSGGTAWYQVDLAPGSSTFGKMVSSGTSTLTGYNVYDWSYLVGQGSYLYTLAETTDSTPNFAVLRWSQTAHTWAVVEAYPNDAAPNNLVATWGSSNATIWGLAATTGQLTRVSIGGEPVPIGTGPTGLTRGDGARCGLVA